MIKKESLPDGIRAKMEGWRRFCRKFSESKLYGYDSETGTYEAGSIAEHFNNMLISIETIINKL